MRLAFTRAYVLHLSSGWYLKKNLSTPSFLPCDHGLDRIFFRLLKIIICYMYVLFKEKLLFLAFSALIGCQPEKNYFTRWL